MRAILEEALLGLMFDIPDSDDVIEVVINGEVIEKGGDPLLVHEASRKNTKAAEEKDAG